MRPVRLSSLLFFAIITALLFCSQYNTKNPLSPDYVGNYTFALDTAGIQAIALDSLEVFTVYKLPLIHSADTFAAFTVASLSGSLIDTTLLVDSSSRDTLRLLFVRPCTSSVIIGAIRPNGVTMYDTLDVRVVNPYKITGQSNAATGETVNCVVGRLDNRTVVPACSVAWSYSIVSDTLVAAELFGVTSIVTGSIAIAAKLFRPHTAVLVLPPHTVRFAGNRPILNAAMLIDSLELGKRAVVAINVTDVDQTPFRVHAVFENKAWRCTTAVFSFTQNRLCTLSTITDTGLVTMSVSVIDTNSLQSNSKVVAAKIRSTLPQARFYTDSQIVRINTPATIRFIRSANTRLAFFKIDAQAVDSTRADSLVITFTDTNVTHKITIAAIDSFGYRGATDTLLIRGTDCFYTLKPIGLPVAAQAKRWIVCTTTVDSASAALRTKGRFVWTVSPQNARDTIRPSTPRGDTLRLFVSDSATVQLTVVLTDSLNRKAALVSASLKVRRYAPTVLFAKKSYSTPRNALCTLMVTAADSNADGRVDSIYWDINRTVGFDTVTTTGRMVISSARVDTIPLRVAGRDNDGFLSATDTARVIFTAAKPFIYPPTPDTVLYVFDTLMLRAHPNRASNQSAIVKLLWSIGTFDTVTTADSLRWLTGATPGSKSGTVRCVSALNDTSARDTFVITIRQGAPTVGIVSHLPVLPIIKTPVTFTVHFADTNGTVKKLFFDWISAPRETLDVSLKRDTASFSHSFGVADTARVTITALDDDSILSLPYTYSFTLLRGQPQISALTIDKALNAIFVGDTVKFTVSARDTNGTIDTVAVDLNFDGDCNDAGERNYRDSVFTRLLAVADNGVKICRARVCDNDGLWSDTFPMTISIRAGRPIVDSVNLVQATNVRPFPLWVDTTYSFQVFARDSNHLVNPIDSVYIDAPGATVVVTNHATGHFSLNYAHTQAGSKTVKVAVRDHDGLLSDSVAVYIIANAGMPVVNACDTSYFNKFVNDSIVYTPAKYHTNSSSMSPPLDSLRIKGNGLDIKRPYSSGSFKILFDTLHTGNQLCTLMVRDAFGTWSAPYAFYSGFIHSGRPQLIVPATVTYVISDQANNCRLSVQSVDTNGPIGHTSYSWIVNGTSYTSKDSVLINPVIASFLNTIVPVTVTANDSDGYSVSASFQVYFDSPPPVVQIVTPGAGQLLSANGVVITMGLKFKNLDVRDGAETRYEVWVSGENGELCTTPTCPRMLSGALTVGPYTYNSTTGDIGVRSVYDYFDISVVCPTGPISSAYLFVRAIDQNGQYTDSPIIHNLHW